MAIGSVELSWAQTGMIKKFRWMDFAGPTHFTKLIKILSTLTMSVFKCVKPFTTHVTVYGKILNF